MKKSVITIAGLGLASGLAIAQEQSTTQDYDPSRDIVTESQQDRNVSMGETHQDSPVKSDYGTEPTQDYGSDSTADYGSDSTSDYGTDTGTEYGTETDESGSADPMYDSQTSQDQSQDMTTTDPMGEQQDTQMSQDGAYDSTAPVTEDEYQTQAQSDSSMQSPDPTEMGQANLTAEQLQGMTVLSVDGEEIGEIDQVGYSTTHQERIVVVEAGGFLGVGEKRIAIPLSELEQAPAGNADSVQSNLSRDSIEAEPEFDEAGFSADEATE